MSRLLRLRSAFLRLQRQQDFKASAAPGSIADARRASHARDDAFDDGKSEPETAAIPACQARAVLENSLPLLDWNTRPVVVDTQAREGRAARERNADFSTATPVNYGVLQEVEHDVHRSICVEGDSEAGQGAIFDPRACAA